MAELEAEECIARPVPKARNLHLNRHAGCRGQAWCTALARGRMGVQAGAPKEGMNMRCPAAVRVFRDSRFAFNTRESHCIGARFDMLAKRDAVMASLACAIGCL